MLLLRRSRWLAAYLALVHGLALLALTLTDGFEAARLGLAFAVLSSLVLTLAKGSAGPGRVAALQAGRDGALVLAMDDGSLHEAQILPASTVTPLLSVILARGVQDARVRAVVLMPDSLPADQLRALRVWLRWRADRGPPS